MARSLWKSRLTALTQNTDSRPKKMAQLDLLSSAERAQQAEQVKQRESAVKKGSRFANKKTSTQKIWSRFLTISPNDLGKEFDIYNGKSWITIKVVEEMIGHKFGEFCYTRPNQQKKPKKAAYFRSK